MDLGSSDSTIALAVQSDGKIVVAGYAVVGGVSEFALARYNPDGSLDGSFGTGGRRRVGVGSGSEAWAVALQADGKILAGGWTDGQGSRDFALVRFNGDGSLDGSFDLDGIARSDFAGGTDSAYDLAVQADGRVVALGWTYSATAAPNFALARYRGDGSLDTSFDLDGRLTLGGGGVEVGRSLALAGDGRILAGGSGDVGGSRQFYLARLTPGLEAQSRSYSYDPAGNRLGMAVTEDGVTATTSYAYDELNQLLSHSSAGDTTSYSHDLNGNRTGKSVDGQTTTYEYDISNRLVKARADGDVIFEAFYDARTRRIAKRESGTTTLFRYDGGTNFQEWQDLDGNGSRELKTELVRAGGLGGGIGSVLYTDKTASGGVVEHFVYNAVGHTVALTDDGGNVTQTSLYEAFGSVVSQTGESDNTRLRNTKERDKSIGLDNDGFRYYDPATGRYINRDPIGYGDGLDVYLSVHNDPVNGVDPLGLQTVEEGYRYTPWVDGSPALPFHDNNPDRAAFWKGVANTPAKEIVNTARPAPDDAYHGVKAIHAGITEPNLGGWTRAGLIAGGSAMVVFGVLDVIDYVPDPSDAGQKAIREGIEALVERAGKQAAKRGANAAEGLVKKVDDVGMPAMPLGGAYRDVPKAGGQIHHAPADSVSPLSRDSGPGFRMETADHRKTASWGSSKEAQAYRAEQKELIGQGKFREAQQMDIVDVTSKFGDKYIKGIQQMQKYTDTLNVK